MKITKEEKEEIKSRLVSFLKNEPNYYFNLSEISRAIGKSPPTVSKMIDELKEEKKVEVVNKKSMKLVKTK